METLWQRLPRPIHALAPMEDVTDTVFRRLVARCGRPDVFFTEFIHTDVVLARRRGRPGVTPRLVSHSEERPLIAQIWGNNPEAYVKAARRLVEMGFDGVDINMGCPVRKIRKKGACSGLILRPALAAELIAAAKEGVAQAAREAGSDSVVPVSVKTRTGFERAATESWVGHLLEQGLDAITVHGRYAEQESEGSADWDEIGRAATLARDMGVGTAVLGNGDVTSRSEVAEKAERYGLDGVMVGRGIFADPYLFATDGSAGGFASAGGTDKINLLLDHLRLYRDVWGQTRNYEILKKFYKIYLVGFRGSEGLREILNETHDFDSAERAIAEWQGAK